MNKIIIKVPTGVRFISDVPEIKTTYDNDLPPNAVIDKQVTGVGGSHIALCNEEPYIVAVHLIRMIENKVEQKDKYGHVFPVTGSTTSEQIEEYLNSGGIKFLCTYDSVPKLQAILGIRSKMFRLLVDEVHCLISYLDRFKPSVALKLIDGVEGFKSVSYLTATPTNYDYLPAPLKLLDQVKFEWEDAHKPDLVHSFANRSLTEDVLSTVINLLDNTTDEIYIFYNSRRYVISLIKKLIQIKPDLNLDSFNILFSDTEENTQYFKKYLGSKFKYGEFPNGVNNKRLTICSSMAFEGSDFYPNQITGANPTSIIVSDPRSKTMRFDINVQLKQICGRFRANKLTGIMPINKIIYLWAGQTEDIVLDEEDFLKTVKHCFKQSTDGLAANLTNEMVLGALRFSAANHHGYWILDENKEVMVHPYAVEAQMSSYHALHSDSFVLDGNTSDSTVVSKLSDLSKDLNTYQVPLLPSTYKTALGRVPSVHSLVKEYTNIIESARINPNFRIELEQFLTNNSEFSEWLEAGVTPQNMNTIKNRDKIQQLASDLKILSKVEKVNLPFKIGQTYSKIKIKEIIQNYYDSNGIKLKAKATDIKKYFEVKTTTNAKAEGCFKIIKKL